jgi:Leucine-rich repeat (LRR) protein
MKTKLFFILFGLIIANCGCAFSQGISLERYKVHYSLNNTTKDTVRRLHLINKDLHSLPDQIQSMENLLDLDVSSNKLNILDFDFGKLHSLKTVNFSFNFIVELPLNFRDLKSLEEIYLAGNLFNKFLDVLAMMPTLRKIDLGPQRITRLRPMIIPGEIGNLKLLESLNLQDCDIEELPEDFFNLVQLKVLDLSNNNLSSLQNSVRKLSSLEILNLSGNKSISKLPDELSNLRKLQVLDISNTNIQSLPLSVFSLPNLRKIKLSGSSLAIKNSTLESRIEFASLFEKNGNSGVFVDW